MRLDICIPAHNEAPIIVESVRELQEALAALPGADARIIVADNASSDGTGDAIRALNLPHVQVLTVPAKGKGAAVITAARASDADYFGFIDADLSAHPRHLHQLIQQVMRGAAIAIGSRLHPGAVIDRSLPRTATSRAFNLLRRLIVGVPVLDSQCGIKVTDARGLAHLRACEETGWFFEIEWLRRAELAGLPIKEVPISWEEFRYKGRASKLKVITDGCAAIAAFFRIRKRLGT